MVDDAEALATQEYQVTAFDISPTAIAWCRERFPNTTVNYWSFDYFKKYTTSRVLFFWQGATYSVKIHLVKTPMNYCVADVLDLPTAWQGQFDLVFECRTIQALPLSHRSQVITAIISTVKPSGLLWVVTRLRADNSVPEDGPPWPVSPQELSQLQALNFQERERHHFPESKTPEIQQAAILFGRL